jgi:hypothetical protein
MGIAYSAGPIQYQKTIRIDTGAHLIADLDALLLLVNWTHAAVITSGFIYQLESPQGFISYCSIQDVGNAGQGPTNDYAGHIVIQMMDNTSGLNAGFQHWVAYGYGTPYTEADANQCQLWIGLPSGATGPLFGAAVSAAVGIPYVGIGTGPCTTGVNPAEVDTIWWSCGSGEAIFRQPDFKSAWAALVNFSYSLNGVTTFSGSSTSQSSGMLNVFPLIPQDQSASVVKYGFETPLSIDPFIGWMYAIHGQVWDAFFLTAIGTLDARFTTLETNSGGGTSIASWIQWNYENDGQGTAGTFFSTLCLLTSPPTGGGEVPYAY